MRKKKLLLAVVVLLGIVLVFALLSDRLLEWRLEAAAEAVLGTQVEIDNLAYYLRGPALSFDRLRVVNPDNPEQNLFETGPVGFYIEARPLLQGKIIIKDMVIRKIKFAAARKIRAELPKARNQHDEWAERMTAKLQAEIAALGSSFETPRNIDFDSLLAATQLTSISRLREIDLKLDSMHSDHNGVFPDLDSLDALLDTNQRWLETDYQSLLRAASLDSIGAQRIGLMLFGANTASALKSLSRFVSILREAMPATDSRPANGSLPDFLVERITVPRDYSITNYHDSTSTRQRQVVELNLTGLTSDPALYGQPLDYRLEVIVPSQRSFNLSGTVDHTSGTHLEALKLLSTGHRLVRLNLRPHSHLPSEIVVEQGNMGVTISYEDEIIDFAFGISAPDAGFHFAEEAPDALAEAIRAKVQSLGRFYVLARGVLTPDHLEMDITSSLSKEIAKTIRITREPMLQSQRDELRAKLQHRVEARRQQTERRLEQLRREQMANATQN